MKKRLLRNHWMVVLLLLSSFSFGQQVLPEELGKPVVSLTKVPSFSFYFNIAGIEGRGVDTVYVQLNDNPSLNAYLLYDSMYTYVACVDTVRAIESVKIYMRDSSKLGRFASNGYAITGIDISNAPELIWLDLRHNDGLESLDVTRNFALQRLLTRGSPLKSIDLKNNLLLEQLDLSAGKLTEIDVSKQSRLLSIDLENNPLTEIDLSHNTQLYEISIPLTGISELNTSIFPNLQKLDISYTSISKVDVTQNPNLYELEANKLKEGAISYIDVTRNPKLTYFYASMNALERVDFSNNPELYSIFVYGNRLREMDLSANPKVGQISNWNNYFTIETMPPLQLGYYDYTPQHPIPIDEEYMVGEEIDLSTQLMVEEHRTVYEWKTGEDFPYASLVEGVDFEQENGKTRFLRSQPYPVRCFMFNDFFPGLRIETAPAKIIGKAAAEDSEFERSSVSVRDRTILISGASGRQIEVFNMAGQQIGRCGKASGEWICPVSAPGVYIVKISQKEYSQYEKVAVI